jgi:16S rRNA (cytosine1402-N4)-methyltransferase
MRTEVITALAPADGERHLDGTLGAGGYTTAILDAAHCTVIALDRDPTAIAGAAALWERFPGRLQLVETPFSRLDEIAGPASLDGVVFDIGVSSMQIDTPERGFSFQADGPLDMRMGGGGETAADVLNTRDEEEIADILFHYGEERRSRALARAIVADRARRPFETTRQLADLATRVLGRRHDDPVHPATRTFQALRIAVNDELGELAAALAAAERALRPAGRLVVVTFHSLEDRIVKRFLTSASGRSPGGSRYIPPNPTQLSTTRFQMLNPKPLLPSPEEIASNPRARSAKLRAARRTEAPALSVDSRELGVPDLGRRR